MKEKEENKRKRRKHVEKEKYGQTEQREHVIGESIWHAM